MLEQSDQWLERRGPEDHIVISSRARYARNLPRVPFPMRAGSDELRSVVEKVGQAIVNTGRFRQGSEFDLAEVPSAYRHFLKENHLISSEMEKGGANRLIFLNANTSAAVMVNEEDHLRMFTLEPGFQLSTVLNRLMELEESLEQYLQFAFSPQYGFLTACPTNTGTGLRASVLLHLPGMGATEQLPQLIKALPSLGLTMRGPYGENSENVGDLYQLSNEITLGRSEEDIVRILTSKVEQVIHEEEAARERLFSTTRDLVEDQIWRAWAILTNARMISSQEAVQLLSKIRLGIDRNFFSWISHHELNRLLVQVQPSHLQIVNPKLDKEEQRDRARATLLRGRLGKPTEPGQAAN